jgi:hypothetical protein
MGLALEVGYLADLLQNDAEGAAWFRKILERLQPYLTSIGLSQHHEPEQCDVFSCDMYGCSGLHYLRRIAAHLDLSGKLPPPGDKDASKDPVLQKYYQLGESKPSGFLKRLFQRPATQKRTFDHLIFHSDAEGYYLPQDFPAVLFPPASIEIPGGMIGSSIRLLDECTRLAKALGLSLDLDPEAEEVWNACESQGTCATQWQHYGIESFTCLRLHAAAQHSIKTGAAIVFC